MPEENDLNSSFREFIDDEEPAIEELKTLVSGELRSKLDGSADSLELLDRFARNLTADPEWASSPLFDDISEDMEIWLSVRIGYYIARCLQKRFDCLWELSSDPESSAFQTPIMNVGGFEVSPLRVGYACLREELDGGLKGWLEELENLIKQQSKE